MRVVFRITAALLDSIKSDLNRAHPFAHERVGFVTAGGTWISAGNVLLTARTYHSVEDSDYIDNPEVGAMIGPNAMRKGLQSAYQEGSALFHVHSHGGLGVPSFSPVDLADGQKFVPSFFNAVPRMPHGLIVLSENRARCLVWHARDARPNYALPLTIVGSPLVRTGDAA